MYYGSDDHERVDFPPLRHDCVSHEVIFVMFGFSGLFEVPIMCECEINNLECGVVLGNSDPICLSSAPFMHMISGCKIDETCAGLKNTTIWCYVVGGCS